MKYAGFWIRVAACIIDYIIFLAVIFATLYLFIVANFAQDMTSLLEENGWVSILAMLLFALYYILFTASRWQATPGKRLMGIYVAKADGDRIGYGRSLWRFISYTFSGITLYIGYLMVAFTRQKRGLHDFIAGTVVKYGKPE